MIGFSDIERDSTTLDTVQQMTQSVNEHNRTPIVRLPSNDSVNIKRILGTSAYGTIAPMIGT